MAAGPRQSRSATLRLLWHLYRLLLAALILLWQFLAPLPPAGFPFAWLAGAYLLFALLLLALPAGRRSVVLPAMLDIALVSLLIYLYRSPSLGLLLAPAVIASRWLVQDYLAGLINGVLALALSVTAVLLANEMQQVLSLALVLASLLLLGHLAQHNRPQPPAAGSDGQAGQRERLNAQIFHHLDTCVLISDESGRIRFINPACRPLLPDHRELPEALQVALQAWLRHAGPAGDTLKMDQRLLQFQFHRLDEEVLIFLQDQSRLHQQSQQNKLAALGRLTASIAHEIRNPLGAISHAAQLLEESSSLGAADRRLAQIISEQSQRMNRVIENIIQLSRRRQARPQALALKPWLERVTGQMCGLRELPEVAITLDIEPADLQVSVDPDHLQQILAALVDNALLHGQRDPAHPRLCLAARPAPQGRHVWLDVIDHGPGVRPEHVEQLFEPFFTTRANGTGLGLYVAQGLCQLNDLKLQYLPPPEGGSCFRLHLPTP